MSEPADRSEDHDLTDLPSTVLPSTVVQGARYLSLEERNSIISEPRKCNATVDGSLDAAVFIAAWALVLSTHALTEDVVFDVAFNGEQRARPCLINVPEDDRITVTDLIEKTRQVEGQLRQSSGPSANRNGDDHARLSTCLDIHDGNEHALATQLQPYPLVVRCFRSKDSLQLSLEAKSSRYTPGVRESLFAHFKCAIEGLSTFPNSTLNKIRLWSDFDRGRLSRWMKFPDLSTQHELLHKVVEEQARRTPLAIAIGETDLVVTYSELNEGADALAMYLLRKVPTPGGSVGNVGTIFSKSALAIVAMLGILKAGGAFVPIDTEWPAKRIEKVVNSANISTILCSQDQESRLRSFSSSKVISVTQRSIYNLKKTDHEEREHSSDLLSISPDSPAYILHTSGSTGDPKGIAISHRSITTSLKAMTQYFGIDSTTRTLQFNAFTFDVSVGDIWVTLRNGGRICMPSEKQRFNLNDFIAEERVNFAFITPSVAATIDPRTMKKHLRRLATIGEAVKPDFLKRYAPAEDEAQGPEGFVLRDTYGPTEASVVATGSKSITISADGDEILSQRAGNIGKPINCGIFIVDSRDPHKLAPIHAPGEIAIAGPTLANGYWNDGAKTTEAFRTDLEWTKDPTWLEKLGAEVMSRVYLTGDIGRYSEDGDGSIVFMYRKGGYMKVNGLRIDPGEIEAAIIDAGVQVCRGQDLPGPCWERTSVGCYNQAGADGQQEALVCFLAEKETVTSAASSCEKLRLSQDRKVLLQHVAKRLTDVIPEYMVPSLFVMVAQMPFTAAAKLDRRALLGFLDGMEWSEIVEQYSILGD